MSGGKRKFDDLLAEDDGSAAPAGRRFDQLLAEPDDAPAPDDGFKPWTQPGDAGSKTETSGTDTAGKPVWSGGSTLGDAATGAAAGTFRGIGINPSDWGPETAAMIQMAEERSPWASGIGQFAGEAAIQTAAAPAKLLKAAPAAQGALSGLLSGFGNASGDLEQRVDSAKGGAALGMFGGHVVGQVTGKLSGLLKGKGPEYAYEQATRGLMKGGATPADLAAMDATGGRQAAYEASKQMGLPGAPRARQFAAEKASAAAEAERAAIEQRAIQNGVQVDPVAVGRAVGEANPYPGVARMDRAAQRNANQVYDAANAPGQGSNFEAVDVQRKYFGDNTNFASGSPNAAMGKGAHRAINGELEDALNIAEPGAGSNWRQQGQVQKNAIEQGEIARRTADERAAAPWTAGDVFTGGVTRMINANRHGLAEAGYGLASRAADLGENVAAKGAGLPAAAMGSAGGQYAADQVADNRQLPEAALTILASDARKLGPYRDQFAQAAGSPDTGAVSNLISKLIQTDPEFRQKLLPLLRGYGSP